MSRVKLRICTTTALIGHQHRELRASDSLDLTVCFLGAGHQNVVMQVLLYNIVFSLSSAFVQYCQLNCTVFPTGKPTPQSRHEPAECQVCKSLLGTPPVHSNPISVVSFAGKACVVFAPQYVCNVLASQTSCGKLLLNFVCFVTHIVNYASHC